MALSSKALLFVAVAAVSVASTLGCVSSGDNVGLFTESVPWGCPAPFECYTDFCGCLGGSLTTDCSPFNSSVTAAQLEICTARRVTCTLNAALNARNVWNSTCQMWGDDLARQYAQYFADNSNTNLTDACMADMCGVVTSGNSALADAVNYTYVCSFVNFSFPTPLERGEVAGCAASNRTYFSDNVPARECSGVGSCIGTYCTCLGGTWNSTATDCSWPDAQPATDLWQTCLGAATGCLTAAALDVYVPGASPLSTDPCIGWSVLIAQDYHAYVSATDLTTTELYSACNNSACEQIYRFVQDTVTPVCTFAAVAGRASTFQPYNECPFSCPDSTCAGSLATCGCTANAVVSGLDASLSRDVAGGSLDLTKSLTGTAYASYGISSGNCSGFDFDPSLKFTWRLSKLDGTVVLSLNSSSLVIAASSLEANVTYNLNLTAIGLRSNQVARKSWTFTAVAPTPTVTIRQNGASLRVSTSQLVTITARVIDVVSGGSGTWSCSVISGTTCPDITNATSTQLIIAAGSEAGSYTIVFTYRGTYTSSLTLTLVSGEIPYVRIVAPIFGPLATVPQLVYLNNQKILLSTIMKFSGNVTYAWTVNDNTTVISNKSTLSLAASSLVATTLANLQSNPTETTISVRATSDASDAYGEATITVVVVQPLTFGLTVANGAASFAEGLIDKLTLTPTSNPSMTTSTTPLGASLQYSFVFFDTVSGRSAAVGLVSTPSGANFVTTAPLFSTADVSSQVTEFGVIVRLNGIVAGAANATFNITKPDIEAAVTAQLAKLSSITDPVQAVAAAGNLRSLMQQSTNATKKKEMADAAIAMMVSTMTNAGSLSSTEQAAVFGTIAVSLSSQSSADDKKRLSQQIKAVVLSALLGGNFDSSNAALVLDAIGSMDSETGGQTSVTLALTLSNDANQPIGETITISISGIVVTAVRQNGGSLGGLTVTSDSGAGLVLPSSFSFAGLSEDAVYGIASVVLSTNPYGSGTATGSIVTYDITSDGSALSVSGLSDPISVTVPSGSGICAYYNEALGVWSTDGLITVVTAGGFICYTTHLTAFGSFASSAATVAVSAVVVLVAALAQLLLA